MLCCFVVSVSSSFIESVFYNPCRLIGHTRVAVLAFNKYIYILRLFGILYLVCYIFVYSERGDHLLLL